MPVRTRLAYTLCALLVTAFVAVAPLSAQSQDTGKVADLATSNDLDGIVAAISSHESELTDPQGASLMSDIRRYREHRDQRIAERLKLYDEAIAEMGEHLEGDKLPEALFAAIKAKDLAVDEKILQNNDTFKKLIDAAGKAAGQSEEDGRWLDALTDYRYLDDLFKIEGTYSDALKRVSNHIRVMRIYAPEKLNEMYLARAKRLGEEDVEPLNIDEEEWPKRLGQVEWDMMQQAVQRAASHHVNGEGYRPVVIGAIESLLTITKNEFLTDEFDGMKDKEKLTQFQAQLIAAKLRVEREQGELGLWETMRAFRSVREANKQTINLPESVLAYELAEGGMSTLDDYSAVIWPYALQDLLRTLQGNFKGVGILLSKVDGKLLVRSPLENGPAIRSGIRAGDVIATVDGMPTKGWTLNKAVEEITGTEGTAVVLGIERGHEINTLPTDEPGAGDDPLAGIEKKVVPKDDEKEELPENVTEHEYRLIREEIKIGSITGWERTDDKGNWNFMLDRQFRIGYIRISQFLPQTADDMDAAINAMEKDGPINGLILDLRFNPGGLLRAAVQVSDRFIDKGVIVSTVDVNGQQQERHIASAQRTYRDFPVVVLVNQGSASASEIVSGALQAYGRATILGARSFGKGSVQDMYSLSRDKALLKLTTQYYRLPNGRIIHRNPRDKTWGIEPDVLVEMTDTQVAESVRFRGEVDVLHVADEKRDPNNPWPKAEAILEKGIDPQLEAALLLLKSRQYAKKHGEVLEQKQARRDAVEAGN